MSVDLLSETPVPISRSPSQFPGRPNISTVWRWTLRGVRGQKLETFVSGGRRFTTHEAITRFVLATTAASAGHTLTPAAISKRREREMAAAEAACKAAGI